MSVSECVQPSAFTSTKKKLTVREGGCACGAGGREEKMGSIVASRLSHAFLFHYFFLLLLVVGFVFLDICMFVVSFLKSLLGWGDGGSSSHLAVFLLSLTTTAQNNMFTVEKGTGGHDMLHVKPATCIMQPQQ